MPETRLTAFPTRPERDDMRSEEHSGSRSRIAFDLILSLAVTVCGALLAYILSGGFPLIGIDDAAITRSYSDNIAEGAGYVYNVGGERVEGSTALLWALMLVVIYTLPVTPDIPILLLSGALTVGAVFSMSRFVRYLCDPFEGSGDLGVIALLVLLLASPGYFLWSVWTMMELALWSATVLWLVLTLAHWSEREPAHMTAPVFGLFLPAAMLPLIRPEGVAVAFGLIALASLLLPRLRRHGAMALTTVLLVFVSVTAFRIWYFGQPFPNTFYAKVSSDRLDDLINGTKYAASFLHGAPLADFFIVLWSGAVVWSILLMRQRPGIAQSILIGAATTFGFLAVYAGLGGDHFALWRFYQPVWPLFVAVAAIGFGHFAVRLNLSQHSRPWVQPVAFAVMSGALCLSGWLHYYQGRFDVTKEFTLTERGMIFGRHMNAFEPTPGLAIGAAGGIALTYEGFLYDVFGLNWTEMAHAKPEKVGMRNHASFDRGVFLEHRPDLFALFNLLCLSDSAFTDWITENKFDGLFADPEFRATYVPVRLPRSDGGCWIGFAKTAWLAEVSRGEISVVGWQ
ncbi:MAG: hypothetical protein AAGK57_00365 [Pseudomonadota bacterium]